MVIEVLFTGMKTSSNPRAAPFGKTLTAGLFHGPRCLLPDSRLSLLRHRHRVHASPGRLRRIRVRLSGHHFPGAGGRRVADAFSTLKSVPREGEKEEYGLDRHGPA